MITGWKQRTLEHGFSRPEDELIDDIAAYFKVKRSELIAE